MLLGQSTEVSIIDVAFHRTPARFCSAFEASAMLGNRASPCFVHFSTSSSVFRATKCISGRIFPRVIFQSMTDIEGSVFSCVSQEKKPRSSSCLVRKGLGCRAAITVGRFRQKESRAYDSSAKFDIYTMKNTFSWSFWGFFFLALEFRAVCLA